MLPWALVILIVSGHAGGGRAAAQADDACIGDCDGNNTVVVNELVVGVGIAQGSRTIDDCLAADPSLDRDVAVNELVGAVSNLLNGCLGASTPSPTVDGGTPGGATRTATASLTRTGTPATATPSATGSLPGARRPQPGAGW